MEGILANIERNRVGALHRMNADDLGRIPQRYNVEKKSYNLRLELDKAFLEALGIDVNDGDLITLYKETYSSLKQWIGL